MPGPVEVVVPVVPAPEPSVEVATPSGSALVPVSTLGTAVAPTPGNSSAVTIDFNPGQLAPPPPRSIPSTGINTNVTARGATSQQFTQNLQQQYVEVISNVRPSWCSTSWMWFWGCTARSHAACAAYGPACGLHQCQQHQRHQRFLAHIRHGPQATAPFPVRPSPDQACQLRAGERPELGQQSSAHCVLMACGQRRRTLLQSSNAINIGSFVASDNPSETQRNFSGASSDGRLRQGLQSIGLDLVGEPEVTVSRHSPPQSPAGSAIAASNADGWLLCRNLAPPRERHRCLSTAEAAPPATISPSFCPRSWEGCWQSSLRPSLCGAAW